MTPTGKVELTHVVLEVRDPEASVEWYDAVLGFAPVRLKEYRAGDAPFLSARVAPGTLLDFFPRNFWRNTRRAENPNHICFTMEQKAVQALRRRLKRKDIPIQRESKRNFGARGYGVSFYFPDPDGIELEAKYYRK
jgi:catechol 2,3-dioxygenase-like lactoylglutathione lyase family enzyme